jgi:hypothetical protein
MDPANLGAVRLETVTWNPAWRPERDPVPWDAQAYAELRGLMNIVPEGMRRNYALKQIETLDCRNPDKTLAPCDPATKPPRDVFGLAREARSSRY